MPRSIPTHPVQPSHPVRAVIGRKRRLRNTAATVALALLGPAGGAWAQAKRCDLVGRDTVIAGVGMKKCLDLAALNGTTITVPSNVTRIDNDGLSLCKSSVQTGGNADIVYIYDNSGSMRPTRAFITTDGTDTLWYENDGGCSDKTTSGTVTLREYNSSGTAFQTRSVNRLVSNAGCGALAGDPFQARGRAMRTGITYQAQRAPQSTAGIMSFATSVGNVRRLRVLSSADSITYIHSGINAGNDGGTNYRGPLDTAKRWLTTPISKNPRKAIVFLSDGRHTNSSDYLAVLDTAFDRTRGFGGAMPPIYGIFMGHPIPDTANLADLSRRTGGQFFLIPPKDPDSLVAVVERILNIILLEYEPATATVTNNSISPTQSATSTAPAGFIAQANGSWLMRLSDIVALRSGNTNQISVVTQFREKTSGDPENQTINFTVSTTGAPTTTGGIINTQFSRVCYDPSRLRILDSVSARPPALTETHTLYQLRLQTAPIEPTSLSAASLTRQLGDDESPSLARISSNADSAVFSVIRPFRVAAANTDGDGTLQSAQFDTVIARWVHPRDAQDVATDTLRVRAAQVTATAWFSLTEGGPITTSYEADQKTVYVVIRDQAADPLLSYTALITNDRFGVDSETVVLRVISPGLLGGSITVSNNPKTRRDGTLQVSVGGDQLQVEYVDPTYGERAVGRAGFDENIQEAPRIEFTDENFVPLANGAVWPPSKGKLYFQFSDDYAYGRVPTKSVALLLNSLRYGALIGDDAEKLTLDMVSGSSGSRATWNGSIDLADAFPPVDSNSKAEARYRGEAVATANGHDNVGAAQNLPVSDSLLIAYPDSTATLAWKLADSGSTPTGTEGLIITLKDQDFSVATNDSAAVTILCSGSRDSVSGVPARESAAGTYVTGPVTKDEAVPNVGDRILSCLTTDQIVVRYTDPVYGTTAELVIDEVARPVANPTGRRFLTEEFVTLTTSTPGATIYYTTDGTKPIPGVSNVYDAPINVIGTTTIRAIAVKPGMKDSKVMVETYTKDRVASKLELLDENGNEVVGGFLPGSAKAVRVRITTTQAGLGNLEPVLTTRTSGDQESPSVSDRFAQGNSFEFRRNVDLLHPSNASASNDTINAKGIDTLIAVWTNPLDPTDVARDTLIIKPAFKAAEVYFTEVPNGPKVTTYADTQTVLYVTVKTNPKDASLVYQVTITSTELGLDDEVVSLTEVTPGVFLAQVPVAKGGKSPDLAGTLQVSAGGDQLNAVFIDPVFKDSYRGDAGFGQEVQESAVLEFVRQDGSLVPPDEIWSPDLGKVYLRYSDDWLAGIDSLVHVRKAKITLVNKKAGAVLGSDEEDVTLTLSSNTATRGVWLGSVELRDRATAAVRNDTLESYYRGEAVASITPHTNKGTIGGTDATDNLVIAYPNKPAEILIKDTAGTDVDRADPRIVITVRDQPNTKTGDNSITVSVACEGTGDKLNSVKLTWNGTEYVSVPPILKGEGDAKADSALTCKSSDHIIVTFNDPVHPETKVADVRWSDQKVSKMFFASVKDSSAITSAADGVDNTVLVIVEGVSPTRDKADTIDVILTTSQGEKLTVKAVETGALTGVFRAEVSYQFITKDPDPTDNKLEANINRDQRSNRVIVNAEAVIAGDKLKAELALFSAYNMVVHAYIKDTDGNGRADKAYFVFDKKLARLPSSLEEVAWNEEGEKFRQKAGASMLSFLNSDSNVVVADFTKSQFGANLTGIPDGRKPYALFPSDNLFGGQLKLLADSVGPVPVTAVKFPSNLNSYSVSATEKRFYPDTLIISVSEPLKTTGSWDGLVRFSKGCAAYDESVPLRLYQAPVQDNSNPLQWTLIVDNSPQAQIPLVGDCIYLETDGRYSDMKGNRPSPLGAPITGENPKLVIRDFRGFPPVAGMDAGTPGFTLVTNDIKKDGSTGENRWSTQTGNGSWEVIWIPPVGFDECKGERDVMKCMQTKVPDGYDAKATPKRDIENQSLTPMPISRFSAVQVIATGRYIARVNIYDNFGVHVRSFVQAFGFWGEEKNPWRATDKGLRSFIVWDLKDKNGQLAGQGVYVWKVNFSFSDKKSEVMYTRTGVMRN